MINLITGGARSGKSAFAEEQVQDKDKVLYIATAKVEDKEMEERVRLHKLRRPSSWGLFEGDENLSQCIEKKYDDYLLDCVTVLCSNYLFKYTKHMEKLDNTILELVERKIFSELENLIEKAKKDDKNLYLVTNELGSGMVPMHPTSRAFRDIQGRINQKLAKMADNVYLVISGIPVKIK